MKSTSSNGAKFEGLVPRELILLLIISCIACLITFFFLLKQGEEDPLPRKPVDVSALAAGHALGATPKETGNGQPGNGPPATDSGAVLEILAWMNYEEPLQPSCLGKY